MADYVNKNCPRCGGYVRLLTVGEVCEKCGYNLHSVEYSDTCSTSADENKTCPICKKALKKQLDGSFKCDSCGYAEKLVANEYTNEEIRKILAEQDKQVFADYNKTDNAPGLYGWICPKCGAVMSPYESFCPNCTKRNWEITCDTSATNLVNTRQQSNINEATKPFDVSNYIGYSRKDKLGYE